MLWSRQVMGFREILFVICCFAITGSTGVYLSIQWSNFQTRLAEAVEDRAAVTDWMVVHDLKVPDFKLGENPIVVFDRVVSRDLRGSWIVEVDNQRGEQVCTRGNRPNFPSSYSQIEHRVRRFTFEQYTGGCKLTDGGDYRITVVIVLISANSRTSKPISFQSNWFKVNGN